MSGWFSKLFGAGRDDAPENTVPARPVVRPSATHTKANPPAPGERLSANDQEFLTGFLTPPGLHTLDTLPPDDRLFLAGIRHRLHTRELDLPVLPEAAIKLRGLLQKSDVATAQFVELLEQDSALSIEVLKSANSMAFARGAAVQSIHDAVVRIGLNRLEGILLLSQLRSKVMKAGALRRVGELVAELSAPLSHVAATQARLSGTNAHAAYTRGTLLHVEHLVILAMVSTVSREHGRPLHPSTSALHQAFEQFGPDIREAVAKAWQLDDLLIGGSDAETLRLEYEMLRQAVVRRWLGYEPVAIDGEASGTLDAAIADIRPRTTARAANPNAA
jgi:HD-like signal output (HDOD) protein